MPDGRDRRRRVRSALGLTAAALTAVLVVVLGVIVAFSGSTYAAPPNCGTNVTLSDCLSRVVSR
jgi:hypothetical protein